MDEQQAGQQLGKHWFITAYIADYMQGLYTVYNGAGVQSTVAVLKQAGNQGHRQPKTLDRRLCTGRSWEAVVIFLFGLEAHFTRDSRVF